MKQRLKKLIAEGNTPRAIKELLVVTEKLSNTDLYQQIITQSAFFSNHTQKTLSGTISNEQERLEIAKINKALLILIDKLPDDVSSLISINKDGDNLIIKSVKKNYSWKLLALIGILIGIFVGISEFIGWNFIGNAKSEALNLTIKLRDQKGNRPLKGKGNLVIDYGVKTEYRQINEQGNVDLRGIAAAIGTQLTLKLEANGFIEMFADSNYVISHDAITLFVKSSCSTCRVFGNVRNQTTFIKNAIVQISSLQLADTTDEMGFFELLIAPEQEKEDYSVTVTIDNKIIWDHFISPSPKIPSEILIQ